MHKAIPPMTLAALAALAACATQKGAETNATTAAAAAPHPKPVRIELNGQVKPQDDFYRHVNTAWLQAHPVPADKPSFGVFTKLSDDAEVQLRVIIEEQASATETSSSAGQRIGDFYRAFMNEEQANALGLSPLLPELQRIDALTDREQLGALLGYLSRTGVNLVPLYVDTDAKDATRYIAYMAQGGTGLPDRDFYLKDADHFEKVRTAYRVHIERMLTLAGIADPATSAQAIFDLETKLAEVQWTKVDSRDADKTYNYFALDSLPQLAPGMDWSALVQTAGIAQSPGLVVSQPSFYTAWAQILEQTPLPTLRAYLKWNLISSFAPYLSDPFVEEDFAFYGATLEGIAELKPRWKRAVDATEGALGEALGRIYVERHFPAANKARMEALVQNLIKAYAESIRGLSWMSAETKDKALQKLAKFTPKIGYPDKWRDYSALVIKRDDLVGNILRSHEFETDYQTGKLGKPIDRGEWFMTPQTVNAYYNPGMNEIVFPAAILQPPFFDMRMDDAFNYGAIGAVIGHEISHGFDDQGSKYDGDGNLKSWWTAEDRARFEALTKRLIHQYDQYEPVPGHHVNGALTIGENIGDLSGLSIAYQAYHLSLGDEPAPVIAGLSGDQRFFIGWARAWPCNYKQEHLVNRLTTDPHSPTEYRTNGVVRNLSPWYDAFAVSPEHQLYLPPEQRVKIW